MKAKPFPKTNTGNRTLLCPNCQSKRVEKLNRAARVGGTAGAVVGVAGMKVGAGTGAAVGTAFFPGIGTTVGGALGALLGALAGCAAGGAAGCAVDECVIDNRQCLACGHEWHD